MALPTPAQTTQSGPPGATRTAGATPPAYTGLGSPSAVFARSHRESARGRGRGQPLVGGVTMDRAGRVTGYTIDFNDSPPLSDYERLVSATGVRGLPRDHSTVTEGTDCLVYGSPMLKQLLGSAYARVATTAGSRTATVASVAAPGC